MELQSIHPSHIPCGNNINNKRANVCGEKKKVYLSFPGSLFVKNRRQNLKFINVVLVLITETLFHIYFTSFHSSREI